MQSGEMKLVEAKELQNNIKRKTKEKSALENINLFYKSQKAVINQLLMILMINNVINHYLMINLQLYLKLNTAKHR